MVSCSDYGDINVRALPAGTIVAKLQISGSECEGLEIRGNEIFAATGTEANIFPIRNEAKPRTFKLAAGRKYGSSVFAVSRDGTLVASAGDDGKLAVHSAGGGAKRWVITLPINKDYDEEHIEVVALAFDARGHQLATVTEDGIVRIYAAQRGKQLRTYKLPMAAEGYQRPTSLVWLGTRVAVGRVDGRVQIHDGKSKLVFESQHHEGGIFSLAANQNRLVAGTEDGSVLVWDLH
jgi:WD40 repeat protein